MEQQKAGQYNMLQRRKRYAPGLREPDRASQLSRRRTSWDNRARLFANAKADSDDSRRSHWFAPRFLVTIRNHKALEESRTSSIFDH
jgi:hypothetical protein